MSRPPGLRAARKIPETARSSSVDVLRAGHVLTLIVVIAYNRFLKDKTRFAVAANFIAHVVSTVFLYLFLARLVRKDWAAWLGVATWFGTVLLAGSGPEPWRGTRWAWTWLTLFGGPLGCLGFFLLGGPFGLLPPRDPGRRRLSGGWAFLIALVVFGGTST